MARWQPDARARLVRAAIDLYAEQGYEATTAAQVAERAGLTKATFFRHFSDKREPLFAGQEHHAGLLIEGAAAAPPGATPLQIVRCALDHLTADFSPEQRDFGLRLRNVIAATGELQERAAFKRARLAEALAGALREREVTEPSAGVAAALGIEAFHRAYVRWTDEEADDRSYGELARAELQVLYTSAVALNG